MKTKEKILEILNDNIGKCISGGEIAKTLSVTRNAVWKGINALKNEGYDIVSVSNSGYVLNTSAEIFSKNSITNPKIICNYLQSII